MRRTERASSGRRRLRAPASMQPRVLPVVHMNASLVRISDAFMLMNASFASTNAALVLVSQLTRPLSTGSFVHANDALVSTNEAFILTSYLIDSQMHACCAFCQQQLNSSKQITAHFQQNAEGRSTLSDTLGASP